MLNTAAPFVRVPKWKEPGRPQQKNDGIYTIEHSSPPLSAVLLSADTVTHGQPQSRKSKGKIPEVNSS